MKKKYAPIFYKPVKEEKQIANLKDQIKRDQNLLGVYERNEQRIANRLAEIESSLNCQEEEAFDLGKYFKHFYQNSFIDFSALRSFYAENVSSFSSEFQHNPVKIDALIQIWLHLSIYQNLYDLKVTSIRQIFNFYTNLKGFYHTKKQYSIKQEFFDAIKVFSLVAKELCKVLIKHYQEYEAQRCENDAFSERALSRCLFFENLGISEEVVNDCNWPAVALHLFHAYYIEPDYCHSSAIYQRIEKAFKALEESECLYYELKSHHLIYILFALIDMANQSSTVGFLVFLMIVNDCEWFLIIIWWFLIIIWWFLIIVNDCEWLWMISNDCEWLWMIVNDCEWLWMIFQ